jgi:hypothetical protein
MNDFFEWISAPRALFACIFGIRTALRGYASNGRLHQFAVIS